jgi:hypothetical protein
LHLLDNSSTTQWTTLVEFISSGDGRADFHRIRREDFEAGLCSGHIRKTDKQPTLPIWLERLEGMDLASIEIGRLRRKKSNIERANDRLYAIQPLVDRIEEIFASNDPAATIASIARQLKLKNHRTRLRLWFSCYLVFGRSVDALYPAFVQIGHWDRKEKEDSNPLGRPPSGGRRTYCHVTKEITKKIEDGYNKEADIGRTRVAIYASILEKKFKCKTVGSGANKRIISTDGAPFPSSNQIRYHVRKAYDSPLIQETTYGSNRVRSKLQPDRGRYSEGVANIFERVEADGYFCPERFQDFDGQTLESSLCVVRLVDVTTGVVLGIGFSLGAETSDAYRMALFCSAIKKSEFGRLFGMKIDDDDWSCRGLPGRLSLDRGPGAADGVQGEMIMIPWREIAASYSPMDKATVESSHPRNTQIEGKPQTFLSAFTPIDAAKKIIREAIKDNWQSDASNRMTPEMIRDGIMPNPMSIWQWLDRRARTSGEQIPFDEAVRTFLSPVEFTATRDYLKLQARRFGSDALEEVGFRRALPSGQTVRVGGYAMNFCVRHAWVTVAHRLVEVNALLPIRDNEEQLYCSIDYLVREKEKLASGKTAQRELAVAEEVKCNQDCEQDTGKEPKSGRWVAGKPKRVSKKNVANMAAHNATTPQKSRGARL